MGRTDNEMMRHRPTILLEGLRKTTKVFTLSHASIIFSGTSQYNLKIYANVVTGVGRHQNNRTGV